MIPEYVQVRIIRMLGDPADRLVASPSREHEGSLPTVGEVATLIHTLDDNRYIVEQVEPDGTTRWLAWFHESELERA